VTAFRWSRVAVHEAGHAVMAMLLGLNILECDISKPKRGRGSSGRCVVVDPDPVGLRRFLVSMGGILAEHLVFGDDRGGGKDREDAGVSLFVYSSKYRRRGSDPGAETIISEVSELFRKQECQSSLKDIASVLDRDGRVDSQTLDKHVWLIRKNLDTSRIVAALADFAEPEISPGWKETISRWTGQIKGIIERIRGF
jgi:hypothetical protein